MAADDRPWYRRPGWYVSALLHGGIVALTLISIPSTADLTPPENFVPVEMLQVADTTNVADKAKADKPKPDPKPAAKPDPKPKTAPTPTPPKPKAEPKPEPKPAPPPPEDVAKADPVPAPPPSKPVPPEPKPVAEPTPAPTPTPHAKPKDIAEPPKDVAKAEPEPKPAPDKAKEPEKKPETEPFDVDAAVAGLEDKEKKDDTSKDSPEEQKPEDEKPQKGKGEQTRQTMAIIDAFKTQISKCWTPPAGAPDAEKIVVVIQIQLNRDGSLSGTPTYKDPDRLSDPYYRAAAESARRAIMGCQNYVLPDDAYDQWSSLTLNFNPAEMLGL